MEVAGLVVGVAGLAGLFSTCVDCFKLVQVYRSRRQDYDVLQTMLDNQQFHLIAWGIACGFVAPGVPDKRFDDPLSAERNQRIERTLEALQSLLTNTEKLRKRYGLMPYRPAQGMAAVEGAAPSAFKRAFQSTRDLWNTSLQRSGKITGSVLWTVNDKEEFTELIQGLSNLIEDLNKFTDDLGVAAAKILVVDYEMQIIGDEASLEVIEEASTSGDQDDIVSSAARRQLQWVKERTILTEGQLRPDDSISATPHRQDEVFLESTMGNTPVKSEDPDFVQPIGIHRVNDDEWRNLKTRQGILPWLPTLLVSKAPAMQDGRSVTLTSDDVGAPIEASSLAQNLPTVAQPGRPLRLAINSKLLIDTLRRVTGMQITSRQNVLVHPFKPLVIYESKIRSALSTAEAECAHAEPSDEESHIIDGGGMTAEPDTCEDTASDVTSKLDLPNHARLRDELRCLLEFMDSDIVQLLRPIRGLNASIMFEDLWATYRPGEILVSVRDGESPRAYLLLHVTGGRRLLDADNYSRSRAFKASDEGRNQIAHPDPAGSAEEWRPLFLTCLHLDLDGTAIGPRTGTFEINPFIGRRQLERMPVLPFTSLLDSKGVEALLVARGKHFVNCIDSNQLYYSGRILPDMDAGSTSKAVKCAHCIGQDVSKEFEAHVIVDHATALGELQHLQCDLDMRFSSGPAEPYDMREVFEVIPCADPLCTRCTDVFNDCELDIDLMTKCKRANAALCEPCAPKDFPPPSYSRLAYMLMNHRLIGYSLRHHIWLPLHVDRLSKRETDDRMFKNLVLPKGQKKLIQAFVEMRARRRTHEPFEGADLIAGKSSSTLLLLHGPPGVGKTWATEAIAARLNQPLFTISLTDLGPDTSNVERKLSRSLDLADKWNCVVTMDDADMLLSKRVQTDMAGNAMIATFLKQLEYFSGLMIMTTNRVGVFDEAVLSRIHLTLHFPRLSAEATMAVWQNILPHMKRTTPGLHIDERQVLEFAEHLYPPWSGRQIRNACESAATLAIFEGVEMRAAHFRIIAEASQSFDKYMVDIHGGPRTTPHDRSAWSSSQREDTRASVTAPLVAPTAAKDISESARPPSLSRRRPPESPPPDPIRQHNRESEQEPAPNDTDSEIEELELERRLIHLKLYRRRRQR